MAKTKRVKKRRRKRGKGNSGDASRGTTGVSKSGGGGGLMQGIRSGIQKAAGVDEKPSQSSSKGTNILMTVLLIVAVGFLLYREYG